MKFKKSAQRTVSFRTNSQSFFERGHRIHSFLIFDDRKMISYAPDFSIVSQKKSTKKFSQQVFRFVGRNILRYDGGVKGTHGKQSRYRAKEGTEYESQYHATSRRLV